MRFLSIKKIAKEAGVSTATVSRVLNNPGYKCSSEELRERIWKIARELNYMPNEAARNLKKGITDTSQKVWYLDVLMTRMGNLETDPFFKRFTAEAFYKLINKMGGEIVYNHADYRLMSKRALKGLLEFDEVNIFLRGMVPMIGYKSDIVTYERAERFAGESKYPLKKMLSFAFEGITSLSVKPIQLIFNLGILICTMSVIAIIYFLFRHFTNNTVSGWTSLITSIWFLGGLQLVAIGLIGEYIGKVYLETKSRPKFIIEKI